MASNHRCRGDLHRKRVDALRVGFAFDRRPAADTRLRVPGAIAHDLQIKVPANCAS
jgi:hypothetical protein